MAAAVPAGPHYQITSVQCRAAREAAFHEDGEWRGREGEITGLFNRAMTELLQRGRRPERVRVTITIGAAGADGRPQYTVEIDENPGAGGGGGGGAAAGAGGGGAGALVAVGPTHAAYVPVRGLVASIGPERIVLMGEVAQGGPGLRHEDADQERAGRPPGRGRSEVEEARAQLEAAQARIHELEAARIAELERDLAAARAEAERSRREREHMGAVLLEAGVARQINGGLNLEALYVG